MRGPVSKRWMVMFFSQIGAPVTYRVAARLPTFVSRDRLRRRAAGIAAREQATAEERAFQRAVAMHAAAAETGCFAGGVEPRHDLAVLAEHAGVEIGLETAQRLAGHDVELDRDQGPMR